MNSYLNTDTHHILLSLYLESSGISSQQSITIEIFSTHTKVAGEKIPTSGCVWLSDSMAKEMGLNAAQL